MEAAIGNQKLVPPPKILLLFCACPHRGNDFQPRKLNTNLATNFAFRRASRRKKVFLAHGDRFWFPILLPREQATLESGR